MDVRDYLRVVGAAWALLLVGLLLGAGVAAGLSSLVTPQYTATTQLFVSTSGSDDLSTAVQGSYYTEGKVASYGQLVRSKELATDVLDDVGLDLTPQELIARIEVEVLPDTTILDVSVTDESPSGRWPSPSRSIASSRRWSANWRPPRVRTSPPCGSPSPRRQNSRRSRAPPLRRPTPCWEPCWDWSSPHWSLSYVTGSTPR